MTNKKLRFAIVACGLIGMLLVGIAFGYMSSDKDAENDIHRLPPEQIIAECEALLNDKIETENLLDITNPQIIAVSNSTHISSEGECRYVLVAYNAMGRACRTLGDVYVNSSGRVTFTSQNLLALPQSFDEKYSESQLWWNETSVVDGSEPKGICVYGEAEQGSLAVEVKFADGYAQRVPLYEGRRGFIVERVVYDEKGGKIESVNSFAEK